MTNIIAFRARSHLDAAANLAAFVGWAKKSLPLGENVKAGIVWDAASWVHWGIEGSRVSRLGADNHDSQMLMSSPFRDFAKAIIVYRAVFEGKTLSSWMEALKGLEAALIEIVGSADVTCTNAAVCDRACELMMAAWPGSSTAYRAGAALAKIAALMRSKRLLNKPFRWRNSVPHPRPRSLKEQEAAAKRKLPSDAALIALGEIFQACPTSSLDIAVTSSVALLLSAPARISELAYVTHDANVEERDKVTNEKQLFLRWYGVKGYGEKPVPIVDQMRATCEEAMRRIRVVTSEARTYAKWLEDNPDSFPRHSRCPNKAPDSALTYGEACDALMLSYSHKEVSARSAFKNNFLRVLRSRKGLSPHAITVINELWSGFEDGTGRGVWENGKLVRREFNDVCVVTLRKLNVLVREKYLPRHFPYTDNKRITKFSEALFTMRTGALNDATASCVAVCNPFGVTLACLKSRLSPQLTGVQRRAKSIFERWNYPGIRVNSHAFRHYLNTAGQRAGLSDVLIASWSGREDAYQNAVYNHEPIETRTRVVAQHRRFGAHHHCELLNKVHMNKPLRASDIAGLNADKNRVLHQGAFGICVHDFSESPCQKLGACLTCGKLACIKGDSVKLINLKTELGRLESRLEIAEAALSRGEFGAREWVSKSQKDLLKCSALIGLLEDPELSDGAVVWNKDNGWTVTNNALAMRGLLDRASAPRSVDADISILPDDSGTQIK